MAILKANRPSGLQESSTPGYQCLGRRFPIEESFASLQCIMGMQLAQALPVTDVLGCGTIEMKKMSSEVLSEARLFLQLGSLL